MKKLQVAVAVASLFAAGVVSAASISQTGVTIAREAIARNDQTILAPTVTFTYNGALSSNGNSSQDFNIVLRLGSGAKWKNAAAGDLPGVGSIEFRAVDAGVSKALPVITGAPAAGKAAIVFLGADVPTSINGVAEPAGASLRYKFRLVNNTATPANLAGVQVNFNVTKAAVPAATVGGVDFDAALASPANDADIALVWNLQDVNGNIDTKPKGQNRTDVADVCSDLSRNIQLNARNFTGSGDGAIGESFDGGVYNNGYILLDQAVAVHIGTTGWTQNRTLDPTVEYKLFTADPQNVAPTNKMSLGSFNVKTLNNAAWDIDVKGLYYDWREDSVLAGWSDLAASTTLEPPHAANNASTSGKIDVANVTLKLMSSNGFSTGSTIFLANSPSCGVGAVVSTAGVATADPTNANTWNVVFTPAQLASVVNNLSLSKTAAAAAQGNYTGAAITTDQIYICYGVDGVHEVPQSTFTGVATVTKARNVARYIEQDNVSCPNPLNGLGGGVKIDVRNFLPYDPNNGFYMGIVRVINNSEKTDADLTGQYIRADGKYGKWGSLGTLPARGARYFTSQEIDAALNQNSTTGDPVDNTGAGGLTAAAGQALPANTRLRISSTKASTLRVQNYIYATASGALTEVSSSQGADFVNIEASDRDHIDQDAQTGIKK